MASKGIHGGLCRFCGAKSTRSTCICEDAECMKNSEIVCQNILKCGHHCHGMRDEDNCPPCLFCRTKRFFRKINVPKECSICFMGLYSAPVVQLACEHIFHYHCVERLLGGAWSGPRISFNFLQCPLCKKEIDHPVYQDILVSYRQLRHDVEQKALQRLQYEGMQTDPAITNRKSPFYKDPKAFAMNKYAYYHCHKCKKPYYGGEEHCQERVLNDDYSPSDLLCSACSDPERLQICPKHGYDYISFKCRYCCSFAVFYCFGTTHFCRICHDNNVLLTKMEKCKLPKCPAGPQGQQLPGEVCPLQIDHPPTGEEFPLGCALCKNIESS